MPKHFQDKAAPSTITLLSIVQILSQCIHCSLGHVVHDGATQRCAGRAIQSSQTYSISLSHCSRCFFVLTMTSYLNVCTYFTCIYITLVKMSLVFKAVVHSFTIFQLKTVTNVCEMQFKHFLESEQRLTIVKHNYCIKQTAFSEYSFDHI